MTGGGGWHPPMVPPAPPAPPPPCQVYRMYRVFKTLFEMLHDRGYLVKDEDLDLSAERFKHECCVLCHRGWWVVGGCVCFPLHLSCMSSFVGCFMYT